jgi:toxin secretion/phage lysis holin
MNLKSIGMYLLSATAGENGREVFAGGIIAVIGTIATTYLGGWDTSLQLLAALMIADYLTGVLGAFKTKNFNSDVMFWGGVRKGIVLLVIMLAVKVDMFVGNGSPVFRTLAMYFYIGREGLSVIENMGVIGVPLPDAFKKTFTQLQEKGGGIDETKKS